MGNVIAYLSSILGSKSVEESDSDGTLKETQVENPPVIEQKPVDVDEIAVGLKSTTITSRDQWDDLLERAQEEPAEIPVIVMYLQLRVASPTHEGGYLCVRQDGRVCYDGKPNAFNTIFKASRVYPPPIDKFQFLCGGGPARNHVLYPEGTELKSKKYEAEKDYVTQNTAEPTLLNLEIHNDGEFLISIESREGIVTGTDCQPIKFIPYLAENFERELAPL